MKETCVSSRPASAGRIESSSSLPQAGTARLDPHPLELLAGERRLEVGVEQLGAGLAELVVRDPTVLAEDDDRRVLLGLDLDLGREPRAKQVRAHRLPETGLGQQQEVAGLTAHDDERRDQPRLRRQEEGLARRGGDVVRQHPLQEVLRVGPGHPDVVPGPRGHSSRNRCHAQ